MRTMVPMFRVTSLEALTTVLLNDNFKNAQSGKFRVSQQANPYCKFKKNYDKIAATRPGAQLY